MTPNTARRFEPIEGLEPPTQEEQEKTQQSGTQALVPVDDFRLSLPSIEVTEVETEVTRQALEIVEKAKGITIIAKKDALALPYAEAVKKVEESDKLIAGLDKNIKAAEKTIKEDFKDRKEAYRKVHGDLCGREKEILEPLKEARETIKGKGKELVYLTRDIEGQEEKRLREQAKKEAEETRNAAIAKFEDLTVAIKSDEEKLSFLRAELEKPETTEVEAEIIRGQLAVFESSTEEVVQEARQAQANVTTASMTPASRPLSTPKKKTGSYTKDVYEVKVVNLKALLQAVIDGNLGIGIIKEFDMVALTKLAEQGIDLGKYGCEVKKDIDYRTRSRR